MKSSSSEIPPVQTRFSELGIEAVMLSDSEFHRFSILPKDGVLLLDIHVVEQLLSSVELVELMEKTLMGKVKGSLLRSTNVLVDDEFSPDANCKVITAVYFFQSRHLDERCIFTFLC
ncbi:unnamed protein product [Arabis nemorensis]|uniref:Uncharacterized protein n=1 Tax=Arabis nemorensis TaxID=586526 RepID=A0A565B3E9_9BRAS|nr:unnamed protein product [Arabis nemorensis]